MPLLILLNLVIVVACALFLLTQIVRPLYKNTPLFPLFRSSTIRDKVNETRDKVSDLREQIAAQQDLQTLEAEKARLEEQLGTQSTKSVSNKD